MTVTPVVIPDLGEIVEAVRIVRWVKEVGAAVARDEDLLEVATDKMDVMIQSPADGVLVELLSAAGDRVPIGAEVARIRLSEAEPG